jgi:hypothetical protein
MWYAYRGFVVATLFGIASCAAEMTQASLDSSEKLHHEYNASTVDAFFTTALLADFSAAHSDELCKQALTDLFRHALTRQAVRRPEIDLGFSEPRQALAYILNQRNLSPEGCVYCHLIELKRGTEQETVAAIYQRLFNVEKAAAILRFFAGQGPLLEELQEHEGLYQSMTGGPIKYHIVAVEDAKALGLLVYALQEEQTH